MTSRRLSAILACALALAACAMPPAHVPVTTAPPRPLGVTYAVTDLGVAPRHPEGDFDAPDVRLAGINHDGQVAGELAGKRFLWTPTTPNAVSGSSLDFAALLGVPHVEVDQINSYGQIAGVTSESAAPGAPTTAFLWTPRAPNGSVGDLSLLGPSSHVGGLNDWGQVLYAQRTAGVLWTPSAAHGRIGTCTDIAPVAGDDSAEALGLNDYGQVIAQSYVGSHYAHAYLWTPDAPHGTSGTATILRSDGGEVTAINAFGQVLGSTIHGDSYLWTPSLANGTRGVQTHLDPQPGDSEVDFQNLAADGSAEGTSFGGTNHAVVWMPRAPHAADGTLTSIGAVDGDADSNALVMSPSGQAAGVSCTRRHDVSPPFCQGQQHAFVWDAAHGLHDLQTILDPGAAFTVDDVLSLNDAGQIAALGGDANGQAHLLLLTPHR